MSTYPPDFRGDPRGYSDEKGKQELGVMETDDDMWTRGKYDE